MNKEKRKMRGRERRERNKREEKEGKKKERRDENQDLFLEHSRSDKQRRGYVEISGKF